MSEKRFFQDRNEIITWIRDKETWEKLKTDTDVINKLNELAEEKEYYQIKSGECEEELLKLRRENEQLKQSNKDAWNLIQFIYEEIKEDGSMDWGRIQDLVEF